MKIRTRHPILLTFAFDVALMAILFTVGALMNWSDGGFFWATMGVVAVGSYVLVSALDGEKELRDEDGPPGPALR